jgi:hypothetical protein
MREMSSGVMVAYLWITVHSIEVVHVEICDHIPLIMRDGFGDDGQQVLRRDGLHTYAKHVEGGECQP